MLNVDPLLGPLAGQRWNRRRHMHALLAGSPALDAGNSTLATDQREPNKAVRSFHSSTNAAGSDGSDIGASRAADRVSQSLVVTTATDVVNGYRLRHLAPRSDPIRELATGRGHDHLRLERVHRRREQLDTTKRY